MPCPSSTPSPITRPTLHLPPSSSSRLFGAVREAAYKIKRDKAAKRPLVPRKDGASTALLTENFLSGRNSDDSQQRTFTSNDKGRFVIRRKRFIPSHYCISRFKGAGFSEVFEGSPLRRFVMLLPCALHSLLCALSCAWWLHGGAASRLKSPSLPIQPEREPLPFKGTSGMLFLET